MKLKSDKHKETHTKAHRDEIAENQRQSMKLKIQREEDTLRSEELQVRFPTDFSSGEEPSWLQEAGEGGSHSRLGSHGQALDRKACHPPVIYACKVCLMCCLCPHEIYPRGRSDHRPSHVHSLLSPSLHGSLTLIWAMRLPPAERLSRHSFHQQRQDMCSHSWAFLLAVLPLPMSQTCPSQAWHSRPQRCMSKK